MRLLHDQPGDRAVIAEALMSLLIRENTISASAAPGSLGESYGDYHASLIWSVATLHDARATNALLGAIKTGGLATDGLVALGAAAMPAVIKVADSSADPQVRMGAALVLGKMAMQRAPLGLQ